VRFCKTGFPTQKRIPECSFPFLSVPFSQKFRTFVYKTDKKRQKKEMKQNITTIATHYLAPQIRAIGCTVEQGFNRSSGAGIKDPIFEDEVDSWDK